METKTQEEDATLTTPQFRKEKNDPLRFYYKTEGGRILKTNVNRLKGFSKKFLRVLRQEYKKKPFTLPNIKTFEGKGLSKAGNITSFAKSYKQYLIYY